MHCHVEIHLCVYDLFFLVFFRVKAGWIGVLEEWGQWKGKACVMRSMWVATYRAEAFAYV